MARKRRSKDDADEFFPGFTDIAEIGIGSLATVYRAKETGTNRNVALKLLNVRDASPRALESFERESVALGAVSSHPNIVTLFRSFRAADGRPVLVLELCRGSIGDSMREGEGLPVADVVAMGIKIAGALETAHRAEILHRDVKPQNILITEFGEPALADFGVAMLQSSTQTTAGLFDFTTLHAAPELLEGGETSAATDVYELASSLYQLIAGKSAFRAYDGESPASVILRILRDPVQPLVKANVPTQLSDLLLYAMNKDKDERPPTAAEFAAELATVESEQGWPRTQFLIRDVNGDPVGLPSVSRLPQLRTKGGPPVGMGSASGGMPVRAAGGAPIGAGAPAGSGAGVGAGARGAGSPEPSLAEWFSASEQATSAGYPGHDQVGGQVGGQGDGPGTQDPGAHFSYPLPPAGLPASPAPNEWSVPPAPAAPGDWSVAPASAAPGDWSVPPAPVASEWTPPESAWSPPPPPSSPSPSPSPEPAGPATAADAADTPEPDAAESTEPAQEPWAPPRPAPTADAPLLEPADDADPAPPATSGWGGEVSETSGWGGEVSDWSAPIRTGPSPLQAATAETVPGSEPEPEPVQQPAPADDWTSPVISRHAAPEPEPTPEPTPEPEPAHAAEPTAGDELDRVPAQLAAHRAPEAVPPADDEQISYRSSASDDMPAPDAVPAQTPDAAPDAVPDAVPAPDAAPARDAVSLRSPVRIDEDDWSAPRVVEHAEPEPEPEPEPELDVQAASGPVLPPAAEPEPQPSFPPMPSVPPIDPLAAQPGEAADHPAADERASDEGGPAAEPLVETRPRPSGPREVSPEAARAAASLWGAPTSEPTPSEPASPEPASPEPAALPEPAAPPAPATSFPLPTPRFSPTPAASDTHQPSPAPASAPQDISPAADSAAASLWGAQPTPPAPPTPHAPQPAPPAPQSPPPTPPAPPAPPAPPMPPAPQPSPAPDPRPQTFPVPPVAAPVEDDPLPDLIDGSVAGVTGTTEVPTWAFREATNTGLVQLPQGGFGPSPHGVPQPGSAPGSDLTLDPMSLRRRVTIRSGGKSLVVDDQQLVLKSWWRKNAISWPEIHGFELRFDDVSGGGSGGSGRIVALTSSGPVELPATKRTMSDLRYVQALLDAYRTRAQLMSRR